MPSFLSPNFDDVTLLTFKRVLERESTSPDGYPETGLATFFAAVLVWIRILVYRGKFGRWGVRYVWSRCAHPYCFRENTETEQGMDRTCDYHRSGRESGHICTNDGCFAPKTPDAPTGEYCERCTTYQPAA